MIKTHFSHQGNDKKKLNKIIFFLKRTADRKLVFCLMDGSGEWGQASLAGD